MAITRISRLRGCGVFRDFTWPTGLPEFGRYNLIYGWNGSGKTTISRLLRSLEARTAPTTGQVTLGVDGRDVRGDEFAQVILPVRVFNRDFIEESVFPRESDDLPPIFVLGKESVERQKDIDRLKASRRKSRRACRQRVPSGRMPKGRLTDAASTAPKSSRIR